MDSPARRQPSDWPADPRLFIKVTVSPPVAGAPEGGDCGMNGPFGSAVVLPVIVIVALLAAEETTPPTGSVRLAVKERLWPGPFDKFS